MTETGHWNRIDERIDKLGTIDTLEQERRKLEKTREIYDEKVDIYEESGGRINRDHDWVFRFVVRQSLEQIQDKIDALELLGSVANSSE